MHQNASDVAVAHEIFNQPYNCDTQSEPRNLQAEKHYQYNSDDGRKATKVIPLNAVRLIDFEKLLYSFHWFVSPLFDDNIITEVKSNVKGLK